MLFADKQQLQHQLEVDLLALRQKELDHFTTCCLTLASPAALIAGFAYSGIAEVTIPDDVHWATEGAYYVLTVAAMLFQIAATIRASLVALMGPALALRGKAGSMHRSVEAMEPCFRGAWRLFLAGMFCILMSTMINVFQQSQYWASAAFVGAGICLATFEIYRDISFVSRRFELPAHQVERGAFSRQEVSSMFSGRRAVEKRRAPPVSRSATTAALIRASEDGAPPPDPRLRGLTREQTREVQQRASPRRAVGGAPRQGWLRELLAARAPGGAAPAACAPRGEPPGAAGAPPGEEPRPAARSPTRSDASRRAAQPADRPRVTFSPLRPGRHAPEPAAAAQGAPAALAPAAVGGLSRRGSLPPLGAVAVPLPAQAESRRRRGCSREAGAQASAGLSAEGGVHVVLTVREGKRLRWEVPAGSSVEELRLQAETFFNTEVEALLDAHGAAFASPAEEQVGRHARLSEGERVAFFEVLPRAAAAEQLSLPRTLWNFLAQI